MKTINVTFDQEEIDLIEKAKGNLSWHDFILNVANNYKQEVQE